MNFHNKLDWPNILYITAVKSFIGLVPGELLLRSLPGMKNDNRFYLQRQNGNIMNDVRAIGMAPHYSGG